ncbi:MAG: energy-coupling factor ABC transporter permease [Magnetococcales bacterium]|nr:energy-coupling factor ABC transporter permease [Magnetococcales bacterium]
MHIEPGFVTPAKILIANSAAIGIISYQGRTLLARPTDLIKVVLAALFFSLFMQSLHRPVGPSELHFIGASTIYLLFGFTPTLLGFAAGLLLQGVLFDPADMVHLGVNALSLMLPLILVHKTGGRKLLDRSMGSRLCLSALFKLDAVYYGGVTAMVGFWLLISEVPTTFSAWGAFVGSYVVIVLLEPFVTFGLLRGLKKLEALSLFPQAKSTQA